jgi:hypothetical protein
VLLPRLLPLLAKLVVDHNPQVRQSSAEALVGIAAFLAPEDIEPKLMPIVVNLATDASEEVKSPASLADPLRLSELMYLPNRLHLLLLLLPHQHLASPS